MTYIFKGLNQENKKLKLNEKNTIRFHIRKHYLNRKIYI